MAMRLKPPGVVFLRLYGRVCKRYSRAVKGRKDIWVWQKMEQKGTLISRENDTLSSFFHTPYPPGRVQPLFFSQRSTTIFLSLLNQFS